MPSKFAAKPWVEIWTKTRKTIREVVQVNPKNFLVILSWIYGFPFLLQLSQNLSLGERLPLGGVLVACAVLAFGVGLLGVNIIAGLLHWTGKWIGGKASFQYVRAAVLWSNVPNAFNVLIWIGMVLVFGAGVLTRSFSETFFTGGQLWFVFSAFLIQTVVSVWGFIILLKALSEVQGFSVWKALLNVLIPFFMVTIGFWVIVKALYMLGGI